MFVKNRQYRLIFFSSLCQTDIPNSNKNKPMSCKQKENIEDILTVLQFSLQERVFIQVINIKEKKMTN